MKKLVWKTRSKFYGNSIYQSILKTISKKILKLLKFIHNSHKAYSIFDLQKIIGYSYILNWRLKN